LPARPMHTANANIAILFFILFVLFCFRFCNHRLQYSD
jgi:hypothetical protein